MLTFIVVAVVFCKIRIDWSSYLLGDFSYPCQLCCFTLVTKAKLKEQSGWLFSKSNVELDKCSINYSVNELITLFWTCQKMHIPTHTKFQLDFFFQSLLLVFPVKLWCTRAQSGCFLISVHRCYTDTDIKQPVFLSCNVNV